MSLTYDTDWSKHIKLHLHLCLHLCVHLCLQFVINLSVFLSKLCAQMYEVIDNIIAFNSLSVSKIKLILQRNLDELHFNQSQDSEHKELKKLQSINVYDRLSCFRRYEKSIPSSVNCKVFSILKNRFLTCLKITVIVINFIHNHSYKVFQSL